MSKQPIPQRILFFDHTAMLGGGEIALLNLAIELDRARFIPVVLLGSDGPLVGKLRAAGVETHILPLDAAVLHTRKDSIDGRSLFGVAKVFRTVAYAFTMARFLRRGRFALLHTNSLKADIIGGIAGRITGTPILWHVRDRIAEDYLPKKVVLAFRFLSSVVPHYVIANSEATLATLPLAHGAAATAIPSGLKVNRAARYRMVIHDGVSGPAFDPPIGPMNARRIGLVGRIAPWKGQDVFLRAAARVRKQYPDVRFQIIGAPLFHEADFDREVRALSTALGLDSCVVFTGFRDDVPALVEKLDILVHASKTPEPFGQVVAEGMLAAKPVVATRGGGVLEIVQDGVTGLLVPMNDSDSMADAIMALLADPDRATEMGLRGRQRILEHFTIAQTAAKVQDVYDRMLKNRAAHR